MREGARPPRLAELFQRKAGSVAYWGVRPSLEQPIAGIRVIDKRIQSPSISSQPLLQASNRVTSFTQLLVRFVSPPYLFASTTDAAAWTKIVEVTEAG
jgi:hypothetical protein